MAFDNWNLATLTGDGVTKDLIGQGNAGYEVVISSIWIANNNVSSNVEITLYFTDSADTVYFKITRTVAAGGDIFANVDGNGAICLVCLNNQDKLKITSDQSDVNVIVSKDETYAG